jgi:hypothetical protein
MRWPAPPLPVPVAPPRKEEPKAKAALTPEKIYADTMRSALTTSESSFCGIFWGSRGCRGRAWSGLLRGRGRAREEFRSPGVHQARSPTHR